MSTPKLSIGVMTYNYGHFIDKAIESILNQSFQDWELIISDDCSIDDTEIIVQKYLNDKRISYIKHSENLGQANNWNYLLQAARGKYVGILHADDYWLPGIFSKTVEYFESNPRCDLLYYNWKFLHQSSKQNDFPQIGPNTKSYEATGKEEFLNQLSVFRILPSSVFMRRSLVLSNDPPNPAFKLAVDAEYLSRLVYFSNMVKVFDDVYLVYRIHGNSTSDDAKKSGIYDSEKELWGELLTPIFKKDKFGYYAEKIHNQKMSRYFLNRGLQFYFLNETAKAISCSQKALKYDSKCLLKHRYWLLLGCCFTGPLGRILKKNL